MSRCRVGIIGASGYSGEELIRILLGHPTCEIRAITSRQYVGKKISSVFPRFFSISNLVFSEPDSAKIAKECEFVFLSLPHGLAAEFARPLFNTGIKVIDLSADFRLKDVSAYRSYYKSEHPAPELLEKSVYGLPEIYREKIKRAKLLACPGCYPTSIILPLFPLLREDLLRTDSIVISSMSGVSGAGRKLDLQYLFPESNESLRAYAPVGHRHLPEIEQELSSIAGKQIKITFVPHLVPVNRGMETTIIAEMSDNFSENALDKALKIYENEPFVRIMSKGGLPDTKNLTMSNFCDIGYTIDARNGRLIISSCIDNLGKGAAGQAVQCFNIMLKIDEKTALS
jgi:N-acetyl-gamma-glutamyl-phosphate reductase